MIGFENPRKGMSSFSPRGGEYQVAFLDEPSYVRRRSCSGSEAIFEILRQIAVVSRDVFRVTFDRDAPTTWTESHSADSSTVASFNAINNGAADNGIPPKARLMERDFSETSEGEIKFILEIGRFSKISNEDDILLSQSRFLNV